MAPFRDDYERQAVQNAAWQASTPKLTVHAWGPVEQLRHEIQSNPFFWEPGFNRAWRIIAKGVTGQ